MPRGRPYITLGTLSKSRSSHLWHDINNQAAIHHRLPLVPGNEEMVAETTCPSAFADDFKLKTCGKTTNINGWF